MKKKWILIVIFSLSIQLWGQRTNQLNDMIIYSLKASIAERNRRISENPHWDIDTTLHYVRKDGLPLDFPFDSLPNVVFFNFDNIRKLTNPLKRNVGALEIFHGIEDNLLRISIRPIGIRRRVGRGVNIFVSSSGSGTHRFFYRYCYDKQEWMLIRIQRGTKSIDVIQPGNGADVRPCQ